MSSHLVNPQTTAMPPLNLATGPTPNAYHVQNDPRLTWETTHPVDDVFISSSVPKDIGAWPCPRVLKRSGSVYMTPRSPESPTLHVMFERKRRRLGNMQQEKADRPKPFVPGPIPQIESIYFGDKPKTPGSATGVAPSFITLDTDAVSTFSPLNLPSNQLHSLDANHAQGLPSKAFWKLFTRCTACMNFVTDRSVEEHACSTPSHGNDLNATPPVLSETYFLRLLDAYHNDSAGGVAKDVFEQIFVVCYCCGSHMTRRVSKYHKCNEPSGVEDFPSWELEVPFD